MNLDGNKVLVTGATGGIGQAICVKLQQQGARITAVSSSKQKFEALANKLPAKLEHIESDLSDKTAVKNLAANLRQLPAFDIIILNAGVVTPSPLTETDAAAIDRQIEINLSANLHIISAALTTMVPKKKGHIIATVSTGALIALENYSCYSASKFGMRGALWSLQGEVAKHGINVTGLYLSAIDTEMLEQEAVNPNGSPLNFVGNVTTPDKVADKLIKAIGKPKLEVYLPYSDGLTARLAGLKPSMLQRTLPLMKKIGERGRKKYIEEKQLEPVIDLTNRTEVKATKDKTAS